MPHPSNTQVVLKDAMYNNTVPFHPCRHQTNNPEKNQSPTCSSYTHSKERENGCACETNKWGVKKLEKKFKKQGCQHS